MRNSLVYFFKIVALLSAGIAVFSWTESKAQGTADGVVGVEIVEEGQASVFPSSSTHGLDIPDLPVPESLLAVPVQSSSENSSYQGRGGETVGAELIEEDAFSSPTQSGERYPLIPKVASSNKQVLVPREKTQITVLGYHDFGSVKRATEMRIKTTDFRNQMITLKNSPYTVISMQEFLDWKKGDKQLPAQCVLITIDDGWKAVYTDAFPVLREMGFPFTLFVYTQYVNSGGSSLTWDMLKTMMAQGATVGSHSVSHPYPKTIRKHKATGPEKYKEFLLKELGESKAVIEENLGKGICKTYCFPGGYKTPEMYDVLKELGYEAAFDVNPHKVQVSSADFIIPRYMALGTVLKTFSQALTFNNAHSGVLGGGIMNASTTVVGIASETPQPRQAVSPKAGAVIPPGNEPISINVAQEPDINTDKITMLVSGIGKVPGHYNAGTKTYSWKPNRPLRGEIHVSVSWPLGKDKKSQAPIEWSFRATELAPERIPVGWIPYN